MANTFIREMESLEVQDFKSKTDFLVISFFTVTMFMAVITYLVANHSELHSIMKYLMLLSGLIFGIRTLFKVLKSNISDVKRLAMMFHLGKGLFVTGVLYYFLW